MLEVANLGRMKKGRSAMIEVFDPEGGYYILNGEAAQ